jgi:hypothetical protein
LRVDEHEEFVGIGLVMWRKQAVLRFVMTGAAAAVLAFADGYRPCKSVLVPSCDGDATRF